MHNTCFVINFIKQIIVFTKHKPQTNHNKMSSNESTSAGAAPAVLSASTTTKRPRDELEVETETTSTSCKKAATESKQVVEDQLTAAVTAVAEEKKEEEKQEQEPDCLILTEEPKICIYPITPEQAKNMKVRVKDRSKLFPDAIPVVEFVLQDKDANLRWFLVPAERITYGIMSYFSWNSPFHFDESQLCGRKLQDILEEWTPYERNFKTKHPYDINAPKDSQNMIVVSLVGTLP